MSELRLFRVASTARIEVAASAALHRRYSELVIIDLPEGDFGSRQALVEAIDGLGLRILVGVHPLPSRAPCYEAACKAEQDNQGIELYSNLHFGVATIFSVSCVSANALPLVCNAGMVYCCAASWRAHSLCVHARAPHSPVTVSSILSWSAGVAPRAPIRDVPTTALAAWLSRSFDALTCWVEIQPAALNAEATINASLIGFIGEFSYCFRRSGFLFRPFELPALLLRRRDDPQRVHGLHA